MDKTTQLVSRAKNGDQDAIAALYNQTYSSVYKSVVPFIKDEDTRLDIVQDTFIKAFQSLDTLQNPEYFESWIKKIATNRAKDFLRKKKPILFTDMATEDGEEPDFQDDQLEHLPDVVLDRKETERLIKEILNNLNEEQRIAMTLFYYEQRSVHEISEIMECSENTVKSRLSYGRKKVEVEVLKLEKQGTKLYSLAPLPYLLWLMGMAKEYGIPTVEIASGLAKLSTTGTAATAASALGETGTAAVGTTAEVASGVAGKAVATKVVAGALAATMTVGAGAVAVNTISKEKQNEAAYVIYEDFLDRYRTAFSMDQEALRFDIDYFWDEISDEIIEQNPDLDLNITHSWYMDYASSEVLIDSNGKEIILPDTVYEPNMDSMKLYAMWSDREEVRYAFYDTDDDGIDEMFVADFYDGELQQHTIDVYTVKEENLIRGKVNWSWDGIVYTWQMEPVEEAEYVVPGVVYIQMGEECFNNAFVIEEPVCEWQVLS